MSDITTALIEAEPEKKALSLIQREASRHFMAHDSKGNQFEIATGTLLLHPEFVTETAEVQFDLAPPPPKKTWHRLRTQLSTWLHSTVALSFEPRVDLEI